MKKILIIDSEEAIRRVLVKILRQEYCDYKVDTLSSGLEVFRAAIDHHYDLVFTEVDVWNANSLFEWQKILNLFICPVIFVSDKGDIDDAIKIMKAGAYDYITKPPDLNRFLSAARDALK